MKTDQQLQQDISAELKWDPSVHAAHIGVEVKDGVVTLAGQVDSYAEKWRAEHAAQRVPGVRAMATALTVHLTSLTERTDADIAEAIENVLDWNSSLPEGAVQVMVEGGWVTLSGDGLEAALKRSSATDAAAISVAVHGSDVTLSGTVHSWDERTTATSAAWGTPGVRNVVDMLTLAH